MNLEPKGLIFDLEGTLLSTKRIYLHSFNGLLREKGKSELTREEFEEMFQRSNEDILKELGFKEIEEASKKLLDVGTEEVDRYLEVHDNSPTVLRKLSSDHEIAVVTSSRRRLVEKIINSLSLGEHLNSLVCREDVENLKPDPEPVEEACEQMNLDPRKCMVIGDSSKDIKAGERAGCRTALIERGKDSRRVEPVLRLSDLQELL